MLAGRLFRWVIGALLVALSLLGVPGILSFVRPQRERDDVAVVLLAGEDVPTI